MRTRYARSRTDKISSGWGGIGHGIPDDWEPYRKEIRRAGLIPNPYRLGLYVGKAGANLPAPYKKTRSVEQYAHGVQQGLDYRNRMIAEESAIP
jgi:hypothetical protein